MPPAQAGAGTWSPLARGIFLEGCDGRIEGMVGRMAG